MRKPHGKADVSSLGNPAGAESSGPVGAPGDRGAHLRLVPTNAPADRYVPYAVDWRFLPDEALFLKDLIRFRLANISNIVAKHPTMSPIWRTTLGRAHLNSVRKAGILFIHIPKTAGTSISKLLYGRNLPHYTAHFWQSVYGGAVSDVPSFSVIRHPVERLLSAYRMAVAGGTDIVAYSRYWRSRLKGLEAVNDFIDHVYENRARLDLLPHELRDQTGYIVDRDGRFIIDKLFSLDARRGLSPTLTTWLGRSELPHLNATIGGAPALTAGSVRKLEEIYSRDFEIYRSVVGFGGAVDASGESFRRAMDDKAERPRVGRDAGPPRGQPSRSAEG